VIDACLERLDTLSQEHGRSLSLIGWSLGGLYARELAKARPDVVRQVITMGTPFTGHPKATNAWRIYEWATGHKIGAPDIHEPLRSPPPVPTTSIFSRSDGVVAWQCSLERESPHTDNIEVQASHLGMGLNPLTLYALADRLAQAEGEWRPFDRSGFGATFIPIPAVRRATEGQGEPCRRAAPPAQQADPGQVAGEAMARANGIDICYQTLGDRGSSAILLIMGLGMQLIAWPDAFCESLVGSGFRVIRFDNRDAGHSTHIDWRQRPRLLLSIARGVLGLPVRSPYLLSDMADDAIGLLDALQVARTHLVGVSMGGMIAQCMAARYPERLLSLTSIMSSSGNWRVACGKPAVLRQLLRRPARPDDPAASSTT
jgi:pimeloyl-ACP methyl ester carboxylesterase